MWCETEALCVQSYRNPDVDDRIFDCLLTSIAAVQAEDIRASFLFVGDLMAIIRRGWVLPTRTIYRVAAFDFATLSGCDQLFVGPTYARGETLDLLMTDVPDLVRAAVVSSIGISCHSSMSAVVSMALAVLNLC